MGVERSVIGHTGQEASRQRENVCFSSLVYKMTLIRFTIVCFVMGPVFNCLETVKVGKNHFVSSQNLNLVFLFFTFHMQETDCLFSVNFLNMKISNCVCQNCNHLKTIKILDKKKKKEAVHQSRSTQSSTKGANPAG